MPVRACHHHRRMVLSTDRTLEPKLPTLMATKYHGDEAVCDKQNRESHFFSGTAKIGNHKNSRFGNSESGITFFGNAIVRVSLLREQQNYESRFFF